MTYRTPSHRRRDVDRVLDALNDGKRMILTTHLNADGDGTGCQVALASWLRSKGKEAWIVNPTPFPRPYAFLLPDADWSHDPGSERAKELARDADLAVVLDTGETSRIGRVNKLVGELPKVVVDHHPPGADPIEGISFRDDSASATGELVYDLLLAAGDPVSRDAARALYVAILTDTGSFRFSNASPDAHRVVAELLELGVDPEETYRRVYGQLPERKLRLLQASLETLGVDDETRVAWMTVPTPIYKSLSATSDDIEGFVDYPRMVEGMEVGLLFRETARGQTKVSFRANGTVDMNELARRFGGGGHVKAAGAVVEAPLSVARERVLEATREAVEKTGNGGGEGGEER